MLEDFPYQDIIIYELISKADGMSVSLIEMIFLVFFESMQVSLGRPAISQSMPTKK